MQLARNLAVEYGPHNVRVNCIAPGLIRTDFARAHSGKKGNNDGKQQVHLILLLLRSHPDFRSSYR